MTLEDLQRDGLLLPEDQWDHANSHSTMNKPGLVAVGVAVLIALNLMYWGDGHVLTWVGVGLFLLCLIGFTGLTLAAINEQSRKTRQTR